MKWCIGALLLSFSWTSLNAQAPSLDIFTSEDGDFQFVYPQNYELLVGERILKATQGRQSGISVCDFSRALACVIYPLETREETTFEGAGFSVDAVRGVGSESDCLDYMDRPARAEHEIQITSVAINNRVFRHISRKEKSSGHLLDADSYRIFKTDKCYELRIQVSVSDEPHPQRLTAANSPGDIKAETARESLKLILSSVVFRQ